MPNVQTPKFVIRKNKIAPNSKVVPTAEIITELYNKHPKLKMEILHGHPSKVVQYALAVIFYTQLTNKDPRELEYNYKIKDGLAEEIKELTYTYFQQKKQ